MKFEITHDSLALNVFAKASTDSKARRQVQNLVEREFRRYQERNKLLTQEDLDEIRPFLNEIDFSEEQRAFIRYSRRVLRRKRRRSIIIAIGVIILLLIALIIALFSRNAAQAARKVADTTARKANYDAKMFESVVAYQIDGNPSRSIQLTLDALAIDTSRFLRKNTDFQTRFFNAFFQGQAEAPHYFYKQYPSNNHSSKLKDITYAKKGEKLIGITADSQLVIYDSETRIPKSQQFDYKDLHFSPGQDDILGLRGKEVLIWDADSELTNTLSLEHGQMPIRKIYRSPEDEYFAGITNVDELIIWDRRGQQIAAIDFFKRQNEMITDIRFLEGQGNLFIQSTPSDQIYSSFYILPFLKEKKAPIAIKEPKVSSMEIAPNGKAFLFVNQLGKVYSRPIGQNYEGSSSLPGVPYNTNDACYRATFSPKGNFVVTISLQQRVSIWTYSNKSNDVRKLGDNLNTEGLIVKDIVWTADEQQFAIITQSNEAQVYRLESFNYDQPIQLQAQLVGHQNNINGLRFSPDGKRLITFDASGAVFEWISPFDSALHPAPLVGKYDCYQAVPGAPFYVAQASKEALQLIQTKDNQPLAIIEETQGTSIELVSFNASNKTLALAGKNEKQLWLVRFENNQLKGVRSKVTNAPINDLKVLNNNIVITTNQGKLYTAPLVAEGTFQEMEVSLPDFVQELRFTSSYLIGIGNENKISLSLWGTLQSDSLQTLEIEWDFNNRTLLDVTGGFLYWTSGDGQLHLSQIGAETEQGYYSEKLFQEDIEHLFLLSERPFAVSSDGLIKWFTLPDSDKSYALKYPAYGSLISVSADEGSNYLYTLDSNGNARRWNINIDTAIKNLKAAGIIGLHPELADYMAKQITSILNAADNE